MYLNINISEENKFYWGFLIDLILENSFPTCFIIVCNLFVKIISQTVTWFLEEFFFSPHRSCPRNVGYVSVTAPGSQIICNTHLSRFNLYLSSHLLVIISDWSIQDIISPYILETDRLLKIGYSRPV